MSHRLGALLLPAPPAAAESDALGDPALDVLASFFRAIIEHWVGSVWLNRAPNEPIIRGEVYKHDPREANFSPNDLPVLVIWREADNAPKRLAEGYQETESLLQVLWVLPPATQVKSSQRHAFFSAFDKAINLAVLQERDPAWVHPSDVAGPGADAEDLARDAAAHAYGSDVLSHTAIDWWRVQSVTRTPVDIPVGNGVHRHQGYLASLRIGETTQTDPSVSGVAFNLRFDVSTGPEPRDVLEQAAVPTPEPPAHDPDPEDP